MKQISKLVIIGSLILVAPILAACGQSSTSNPTQTPVFVVVDDDDEESTPEDEPSPTATPLPADDDEDTPRSLPERDENGVPEDIDCDAGIVEQTFENGRMFWVGRTLNERCSEEHEFVAGTGEIWVVIFDEQAEVGEAETDTTEDAEAETAADETAEPEDGISGYPVAGEWLTFVDNWDEDTDPQTYDSEEELGDDLLVPIRGFGRVWAEELTDAQREALGFATQDEVGYVSDYEYEFDGFLNGDNEFVERPGIHKIETIGDEAFYLDEASGEFSYDEDD